MPARETLEADDVTHRYGSGPIVLNRVSLSIAAGDTVALVGPSGSGKTTLLSILGLLTVPTTGDVRIDGDSVPTRGRRRSVTRLSEFAWVFQSVNVLSARTALDNAALGLLARGVRRALADGYAQQALEAVGLSDRAIDSVAEFSGGELQRVCIARALAAIPRFVLADEPTGQLDDSTSRHVLDALWAARHPETALVIATHDWLVAKRCDRVIRIVNGSTEEVSHEDLEASRSSD